jgi:glycosyltransferase involved in cell wall biosynthesis
MLEYPAVSVIIATYNRCEILNKALRAIASQEYPNRFEIVVVDDGSTDNTGNTAKRHKALYFRKRHEGPDIAKNLGIRKSRHPVVIIMDDDCIPGKIWMKELVSELVKHPGIGGASSFSSTGGTSTAFIKKYIEDIGLFDTGFNSYNFRDDTDLVFRLLDYGKEFVHVRNKAGFLHLHKAPGGIKSMLKHFQKRLWIHSADPLLYKKHPKRTKKFLDIKLGFIRSPVKDFRTATGLWNREIGYSLSSPQGITFIENKTPLHGALIFISGLTYVFLVKLYRFYGSIKHGKLLI